MRVFLYIIIITFSTVEIKLCTLPVTLPATTLQSMYPQEVFDTNTACDLDKSVLLSLNVLKTLFINFNLSFIVATIDQIVTMF